MRFPMCPIAVGIGLLCMGVAWLGAQERHDGDSLKESTVGKIAWQYDTGGLVFSTPTVAGDILLIGSCAGTFYAFDKRTGKVRWSYNIHQGRPTSRALVPPSTPLVSRMN